MKKFITAIAVALVAASAFAQSAIWMGNSFIQANDTWYTASGTGDWATGGAFDGTDLGEIFSLTLAGQIQSYGDDSASENPAFINYSIDNGAASQAQLDWYRFADNNNWFQSGGEKFAATSIDISGLAEGDHTIAVWFNKPSTEGELWDSNDGNNYVASFSTVAAPVPEPATMSLLGLGALAMVIRRKLRK